MRRPSIDIETEDNSSYEESTQYVTQNEESVQTGTCGAGQSCTGCFSGVMLAYMGLLLFSNSSVVIAMMSLGVAFGLLGSAVEDPRSIKKAQFFAYFILSCVLSTMLSYVFVWTEDLMSIAGVSMLCSTILHTVGFLMQVSDVEKTASVNSDTYKKCQV